MLPQFMISGKHDFYADFPITFRLQLSLVAEVFQAQEECVGCAVFFRLSAFHQFFRVRTRSNVFQQVWSGGSPLRTLPHCVWDLEHSGEDFIEQTCSNEWLKTK